MKLFQLYKQDIYHQSLKDFGCGASSFLFLFYLGCRYIKVEFFLTLFSFALLVSCDELCYWVETTKPSLPLS